MTLKITNGRIIFENEIKDGLSLYIRDGKIADITGEDLPFDKVIDAGGNYISPGFIDLHVHGGRDCDFADGDTRGVITAANFHASHGTTTIFPTTLSADFDSIMNALKAIDEADKSGEVKPQIGGVHLEGPYFSMNHKGAQNPEFITPPVKKDYERILEKYGSLIKRWSFAPELEGTTEFMDALSKYGVTASIGHSDATYDDVMAAYNKGCRLLTHFYSCMSTISREKGFRRLGIIECGYLLDDMVVEVIADGCHVPKELFKMLYKIKGNSSICLVTDAMSCSGSDKTVATLGGVPCKIKNGVAYLMDEEAFAGSIATCDRLVRFCIKEVGLPLPVAVKMMSLNQARVMGLDKKGLLEVGYDADIVIFDEAINIQRVIVKGKEI